MNDIKKRYRETTNAIGVTLLSWVMLFLILTGMGPIVKMFIPVNAGAVYAEVFMSLANGAAYLLAFMLPAAFFGYLLRGSKRESMRLEVKLSWETIPVIFAGMAIIFALSYFNGMFMSFFELPATDSVINEAGEYMSDYSLVLQFITMAIVPAFCEEFLFRGVILSNLMPFGKATAIIGSSMLFGLMHGNLYQFLYTTAAGMVLGAVYVMTDSIWCSTLVHLVNNSMSVIQDSAIGRLDEYSASVVLAVVDGVIFALGLASLIFLIARRGKKTISVERELRGVFGVDLEGENAYPVGFNKAFSVSEIVRGFFCPSILLFAAYSVANAIYRFF